MSAARAWYRLHASTWAVIVALIFGFALSNLTPLERLRWRASGVGRPTQYADWTCNIVREYGWPAVCCRSADSTAGPTSGTFHRLRPGIRLPPLLANAAVAVTAIVVLAGTYELSRRRLARLGQFTTRGALVLLTLAGVAIGWWTHPIRQNERFMEILEGGPFDLPGTTAKPRSRVEHLLQRFRLSSAAGRPGPFRIKLPEDDAGFARLRQMLHINPDNVLLEIPGGLSMKDRERLSSLSGLRHLYLGKGHDENLACLSGLAELRSLSIRNPPGQYGPRMTQEGIARLARLPKLSVLHIEDFVLEESTRQAIAGMPSMESLSVGLSSRLRLLAPAQATRSVP